MLDVLTAFLSTNEDQIAASASDPHPDSDRNPLGLPPDVTHIPAPCAQPEPESRAPARPRSRSARSPLGHSQHPLPTPKSRFEALSGLPINGASAPSSIDGIANERYWTRQNVRDVANWPALTGARRRERHGDERLDAQGDIFRWVRVR